MVIEEPLVVSKTGDRTEDVHKIMCDVNERIETWVRANPAQWMWVHKRWPDRQENGK